MPIPIVVLAASALALCAALFPPRARMLSELGAAMLILGHVSVVVAYDLPLGSTPPPIALISLPLFAARIDAALLLLGGLLPLAAAISAWLEIGWKALAAELAASAAGAWLVVHHWELMAAVGIIPVAGTALLVAAALSIARLLIIRLSRRPLLAELARPVASGTAPMLAWLAIAAAAALALFGPNVLLVLAGSASAAFAMDALQFSAHLSPAPNSRFPLSALPWRSVVVLGCLGYVAWLLIPIAGPIGLGYATLADVPISSAAAALLTPPVAIAALLLASPFPLGGGMRLMLVPIAAALLARVALPLFAGGLDGWRTLFLPAGVLLAWIAAFAGRRASLAAASVWCAGLAAEATGAAGAMLLALALPLAAAAPVEAALPHRALRMLAAAVAGAGGLFAFDGLLRVEVVYAVLLWCAWVFTALRERFSLPRVYSGN